MRKIYSAFGFVLATVAITSSLQFSSQPPTGNTGATGNYCTNCHSSFALNTAGGSVSVSGLPASNYVPGQQYPFSLTITHGAANRTRWGFSIAAVNGSGTNQGSFSTTNANAAANGSELSHNGAVITAASSTYTYNNLRWTAPATAGQAVTFYYVGNAANNANGNQGDYIYSASSSIVLPALLKQFSAAVQAQNVVLNWSTAQEQNTSHFVVQRSEDGQLFYPLGNVEAAGNSSDVRNYRFTDSKVPYYGRSLFYRLQQVDKDGRSTQSDVAKAVVEGNGKSQLVNLYPTLLQPTSQVTAKLDLAKAGKVQLQITDIGGRQRFLQSQTFVSGAQQWRFALPSGLAKGMYLVSLRGENWQQTVRIQVQ